MGDEEVTRTDEEWRSQLDDQQYEVTRCSGTERPFTGKYWDCKDAGTYKCVCCGQELFRSESKYDSGSGWPSFSAAIAEGKINYKEDNSLGMSRIEIFCAKCDSHLGHLFDDGPQPTGKRYCVNSISLDFNKAK